MKNHSALRRKTPWVLVIAMGLAYTHFAHADAQDTNQADHNSPASSVPVVVTATRTPQSLTDTLADITVLDRQALQNSGAVGLGDVLARVPGIEMSRTGGPGTMNSRLCSLMGFEWTYKICRAAPTGKPFHWG